MEGAEVPLPLLASSKSIKSCRDSLAVISQVLLQQASTLRQKGGRRGGPPIAALALEPKISEQIPDLDPPLTQKVCPDRRILTAIEEILVPSATAREIFISALLHA